MKKFIIAFLILCCSTVFAAEGPFSSGSKSISGNIFYSNQSGDAYFDSDIFEFSPSYTICTSYGFFVGGTVRIRHMAINDYYYGSNKDTQWQVGGILEKYFTFAPDGDGKLVSYFKSSFLLGSNDGTTVMSLIVDFGGIKMISETVGVEFGLKGAFDNYSANGASATGVILQAGFGFKSFIF